MDLLETVLRSANADQYIDIFKQHNIEAGTLPLLNDDDLQIIGVENEDIRKEILLKSSTLKIPHEKAIALNIDAAFTELVLSQISHQLHLHNASLSCALNRKDVVVCDLRLRKGSQCLLNCINSLEKELDRFEEKFGRRKKKSKKTGYLLIGLTAVTSSLALCILGRIIKDCITKQ